MIMSRTILRPDLFINSCFQIRVKGVIGREDDMGG